MNLSNYPPGVSGNEPEIVGYDFSYPPGVSEPTIYDESQEQGVCEAIGCTFSGEVTVVHTAEVFSAEMTAMNGAEFAGEWDCPECGHTNPWWGEQQPEVKQAARPRWIIAQDTPGPVEHVMWSLVDTERAGVLGHLLGQSFAQAVADGLNSSGDGE